LSRASREEAEALRTEMVRADVELFRGLSAYWSGMADILDAGQADDESEALKTCVAPFDQVLVHLRSVREHEQRIFEITTDIEFSAYFSRRHEVISNDTAAFVDAVELLAADVRDGFYPAKGCEELNVIVERLMSNFARDARIEGVLTRFEIDSQKDSGS
jgi:hypothetical protein